MAEIINQMIVHTKNNDLNDNKVLKIKFLTDLNMYDKPPSDHSYSYSDLLKHSEKRIEAYKQIERFLESHRENEDANKRFYSELLKMLQNKDIWKISQTDDEVSHWILKILFQEVDKGVFFMNENFIFSARLQEQSESYGAQKLSSLNQGKDNQVYDKLLTKYQRQYFFDMLIDYMDQDKTKIFRKENKFDKKMLADETHANISQECLQEFEKLHYLDQRYVLVPFQYCHRLIKDYKVEIEKGKAKIMPQDAFIVLQELFSEILTVHNKNVKIIMSKIIESDSRLKQALEILKQYYKSPIHFEKTEIKYDNLNINPSQIQSLSRNHFPLCMSEIYESFRKNHQLKHWGRLQLGMFLKGIGLKMEDNVKLFEQELKKTRDGEKKVSEYRYYIEHMYGKRGKKTDYTPWSCQKVASKAIPSQGESFGCPFNYYSDDNLKKALIQRGLENYQIEEIIKKKKEKYNLACRLMFQYLHPNISKVTQGIGKHPNSYFFQSYFYRKKNSTLSNMTNQFNL